MSKARCLPLLVLLAFAGCASGDDEAPAGDECRTHFDCPGVGRCVSGWCKNPEGVEAPRDGGSLDSNAEPAVRGRSLAGLHPALADLSTTEQVAWIGHSRGCARTQNTVDAHADLWAATVGTVFLGPHDDQTVVPGAFLVIGAGKDGQSFPTFTHQAYDRQSAPRWKVWMPGANHGNFADHKVYYSFDRQPEITRHEQLGVTASFVLPFMQRFFGLAEPFAGQLDSPPESPSYEVSFEP